LLARLAAQGIGAAIHYPVPVHLQPAYQDGQVRCQPLPVTEQAAREVLSLPMYPALTEAQVRTVAAAVTTALEAAPRA
jgi:dTDP-4-amino-4,6-dideoxygalactose transaminase